MKLKQGDLAKLLHISEAKLSLIMNGKQHPDLSFLKAIQNYLKLMLNYMGACLIIWIILNNAFSAR